MTRRTWLTTAATLLPGASLAAQVHQHIRRLAKNAPLAMRFRGTTADECLKWQQEFRAKLESLLGDFHPPNTWETIVEREAELDDHRRQELILRAKNHPDLPVYVLMPKPARRSPRPAIVALHGHGPCGHDPVAGVANTPECEASLKGANYDYGLQLARRGYIVAAPCFTPFGRRLDEKEKYGGDDPCAVTFVRMQLLGKILMAENLRDALWSVALLTRRHDVDPERLGCVGLSYGGRMTMLTTALEPRIRVAVISGALNIMQERISLRYSCGAQVIPGLLQYGDVPEIASLIAPRPCLWEVGMKDPLMVKDWLEPALERIRRAYHALDASDELQVDRFDGHHRWNGLVAYPLLDRVLKPNRA